MKEWQLVCWSTFNITNVVMKIEIREEKIRQRKECTDYIYIYIYIHIMGAL